MILIPEIAGGPLKCEKIVVKLGSNVVVGPDQKVDRAVLASLARSIAGLRERGVGAIVVTSGAIAVGCGALGRPRPRTLPEKQALAAVGQISLMQTYQAIFAEEGLAAAQVLLTRGDMQDRRRYLNARHTLERLLALGAVPIINENDTISTDEIGFGDNDTLSAYVAVKMKADLLLLLSTVEGLMRPTDGGGRELVPLVRKIGPEALGWVGRDASSLGAGGMGSKLEAARFAAASGVHVVIAGGKKRGIIEEVMSGKFRGTHFPAAAGKSLSARERWIGFGRGKAAGRILLDAGAAQAVLEKKKSLLPVGVVGVEGEFERGDVVDLAAGRRVIARGLANFSSGEVAKIRGRKTSEIEAILGARNYDEIVHRDNMAIVEQDAGE